MDDGRVEPARHRLNVDDYYRMAEAGILQRDSRVELIDGEVIDMVPIGADHGATVNRLAKALILACGDRAIVAVQNPVRLDPGSEPQPDFAVLRSRADGYRTAHPTPPDVFLLIEVADSTLRYDRTVKLPLYAQAGIAEYWIVNLQDRVVEAHRSPAGDGYAEKKTHGPGDTVALAVMPEIVVSLAGAFD